MSKTVTRDNQKALLVKKLADKHGVTQDYIYKIIDGSRNNEEIFTDYMQMDEALELMFNNLCRPCEPAIYTYNNLKPTPLETTATR
jgi:hypothetical protein